MNTIARLDMLRDISVKETSKGKRLFSIKFVTKEGEVVYYPYAFDAPIRSELQSKRYIGVMHSSSTGQAISSHPTPVCIDNILEYNHQQVTV